MNRIPVPQNAFELSELMSFSSRILNEFFKEARLICRCIQLAFLGSV